MFHAFQYRPKLNFVLDVGIYYHNNEEDCEITARINFVRVNFGLEISKNE
jgi:hypothetical protein